MATHIQLHRSGVTGATPDVSTMLEGEPAVNLVDKKLFVKGADGSLITLIDAHASHDANSPSGSANQIQFKGISDVFAANSSFVFNPSSVRLGIGTSSPRETVEVAGTMQSIGVSADGATFSSVNVGSSIQHAGDSDTQISFSNNVLDMQAGSQDPSFRLEAGNIVKLGDPAEAGDGTLLTVSDTAEKVTISAVQGLEVGQGDIVASSNIQVANDIIHQGDTNTKIEFNPDKILMRAGNTKFLESDISGVVHAPVGISAAGGTFGSRGLTVDGEVRATKFVNHEFGNDDGLQLSSNNVVKIITGGSTRMQLSSSFTKINNKLQAESDFIATEGSEFQKEAEFLQGLSADGATFGLKGMTCGGGAKFLAGLTAASIDVTGNITGSASSIITMGAFFGPLVGNATTASSANSATNATTATNVSVSGKSDNTEYRVVFAESAGSGTSALGAKVDSGAGDAGLLFNPAKDTLTTGIIHAGISADGATFGGDIRCQSNIILGEDGFIGTASDDERIKFNGSGNILEFRTPNVQIERKLAHYGDGDTFLDFTPDNLEIQVGGKVFAEAKGADGLLHAPFGISGGGATFDNHVGFLAGATVGGDCKVDGTLLIAQDIVHSGDSNTKITYGADSITLTAGGTNYQAITTAGTNFADTDVVRPNLKDYSETVNAIGTITGNTAIDFSAGNVQTVTGNGNCEFSFTNPPATGKSGTLTLLITNGGANTTTWHSSVKWPSDVAPSLTASGIDIVSFVTIDAGTNIYGFVGGLNFS